MMKIGIFSDLHLESSGFEIEDNQWDILIIAGDLSVDFSLIDQFFTYRCPNIPIIYVPGNHEYEGKVFSEALPKLREIISEFPNVHLLQNETVEINGIKFIGTTLWSNFEGSGINNKNQVKEIAKTAIVDFSNIYVENTLPTKPKYLKWTPQDTENEFNKAYDFLNYELKNNPYDGIKFVITHFAPHRNSVNQEFKHDILSSYWVNDLENLMGFSEYWVHGHVHKSFDYSIHGTNVICNPRGNSKLFNLPSNLDFNKSKTIEIEVPEKKIKNKM